MSAQSKVNDKTALAEPTWDSARRQVGSGLLSVVMPAFNLGRVISANVEEVKATFRGQIPFELVVVDDGSTDGTKQELQKLAAKMPELHAVFLGRNMGKGGALKQGFEAVRGNYVLLLDADLDLPPKQVSTFFDIMEREKADVVIGSKRHADSRLDYPWYRRLMSGVYYAMVKLLVQLPVKDTQTGIKLFKRETLDWAFPRMLVKQFAFDLEMLAIIHEKGYKIAESPVSLQFKGKLGCFRPQTVRQIMNDTFAVFYRLRLLRYYQTLRDTRMPVPPPLVSIVIAFPAPTPYLDEALHGIQCQTYENYEVLLLPDEPTGKVWPEGIREIPTGRIRPAEKRNIGIQQAGGSIVAFLDDDAFPIENWLKQAVLYFSDDTIGAVGGPAVTPANDPYPAKLSGRVYENPFVSGNYRYRYEPDRVKEVDDYPSCNLCVRTEVLRRLGGFRIDFWPGEDTYLCLEIVQNLHKKIIYDPRVQVYHHRRKLFLPHLRQIGRYALHRGYFAKRFPATSLRVSYLIPSLFVMGIAVGALASVWCPFCRLLYISALLLYAGLTLVSSISLNPLTWLLTWLGVMLTHVVYGVRFIFGFMSSRMPGEVRQFDHMSEAGRNESGKDRRQHS